MLLLFLSPFMCRRINKNAAQLEVHDHSKTKALALHGSAGRVSGVYFSVDSSYQGWQLTLSDMTFFQKSYSFCQVEPPNEQSWLDWLASTVSTRWMVCLEGYWVTEDFDE